MIKKKINNNNKCNNIFTKKLNNEDNKNNDFYNEAKNMKNDLLVSNDFLSENNKINIFTLNSKKSGRFERKKLDINQIQIK